jgi:hypothetical protein
MGRPLVAEIDPIIIVIGRSAARDADISWAAWNEIASLCLQ